jgi:hypothetical protein
MGSQKATAPIVLAQCYQVAPNSKVDPITMLGEAKKICDTLVSPTENTLTVLN